MRRPHRIPGPARAALTFALLLAGSTAAAGDSWADLIEPPPAVASGVPSGTPSWADSGAAFAPRPVRSRVALTAPRPAVRRAVAANGTRPAVIVEFGWLRRGGLAVHPLRTERPNLAALPPWPTLPAIAAVAPPRIAPVPARRPLTAGRPGGSANRIAAALPVLPPPTGGEGLSGLSALERFLRETGPGAWSVPGAWSAPARRTAVAPPTGATVR